jgi:hypothetical protein
MKRRFLISSCLALIMLLSILTVVAQAETPQPDRAANPIAVTIEYTPIVAAPTYTYTTVVTVTSGRDLDTSQSTTCSTSPCTLRRAIVQARNVTAGQRPVLIKFNIPTTETQSYSSTLGIWHIYLQSTADASVLRRLNGNIIIDGATQPGGRTDGPKIFLVGPGTGQKDGLIVGDIASNDYQIIRGLGFQNFKTHIYVNSSNNLIEENWFGLSDDGTGVVLRGGLDDDGSGNTGVSVTDGASNNVIQHNVFAGIAGVAAALNGNYTTFANNYVGTTFSGTVPGKQTDPNLACTQWDWLGGSGLSVSGNHNSIENNIFAGLRIAVEPPSIQADTIRLGGDYHTIRNNQIGVDSTGTEVGVCGRGIFLQGSTKFNQVISNTIANSGLSSISLNDTPVVPTSDANTLRTNTIKKTTSWGAGASGDNPEDAIQVTKSMRDSFRNFNPAKVTTINGTAISGVSGDSSSCPNCVIEVFLDDNDAITEALQSLAVVTATADGSWAATLPFVLAQSQGVRTTSTTTQPNTISGMSAGTTTGLSRLYGLKYLVFLPLVLR